MKIPIKVIQPEINPVPVEVLAASIKQIAASMKSIESTRMNRRCLIALIHDNSRVGKREIEIVLNNLCELERTWLKRVL